MFKNKAVLKGANIAKNSDKLYKSSFADLPKNTVYFDPCGWRTQGSGINAKTDMWKEFVEAGVIDRFNELQEKNYPLSRTIEAIGKNYDTDMWSLPIFHVPDVHVVNPEQTPAADLVARETVDTKTVNVTAEEDQPEPDWEIEGTGEYEYEEGTYEDHEYDVVGYGFASKTTDKLILANDPIRNTQSLVEQAHMNGMRQGEERQILVGGDGDGFTGLATNCGDEDNALGEEFDDIDHDDLDPKEDIRKLINEVEKNGGDLNNIAVFVDFDTHMALREDLEDKVRFNDPAEQLDYGFETIIFDGVPVLKSHALPDEQDIEAQDAYVIAADMGTVYMAMLQDVTVKPLAKEGPYERFATDAYGVLVAEAPSKIQYIRETDA